jgi:hypothetical protein
MKEYGCSKSLGLYDEEAGSPRRRFLRGKFRSRVKVLVRRPVPSPCRDPGPAAGPPGGTLPTCQVVPDALAVWQSGTPRRRNCFPFPDFHPWG